MKGPKAKKRHEALAHLIQRVGAALRQERARLRVPEHIILRHPVDHLRSTRERGLVSLVRA